jgi:cell division protein FtsB
MNLAERFWWGLTLLTVGWYFSVTVYVAIRGALDIRQMLRRLEEAQRREDAA